MSPLSLGLTVSLEALGKRHSSKVSYGKAVETSGPIVPRRLVAGETRLKVPERGSKGRAARGACDEMRAVRYAQCTFTPEALHFPKI
ncbi:hypothetical protein Baya_13499 [Bagarius yarrelli]|uniref:Uncharacterized protein n=1 Tax=Bagarius yarrelli TaxID=175774 RepID=A0A556V6H0_BAGYA|nr:hypothetical protein Baya_13499 [Bagarius yarrelli]